MDWLLIVSLAAKLFYVVAAVAALFLFCRWLDRRGALDWQSIYRSLLSNPVAAAVYFGLRLVAAALLVGLSIGGAVLLAVMPAPAIAGPLIPSTYDGPIRASAERWLPGVPWRLLKGQLYQESRLDPTARSPVGAEGVGQFMPATWAEVAKAMGYSLVDRRLAEPSIDAAGYYMAQLRRRWAALPDLERHRFAAASYNAGGGNISRAWRACGQAASWSATAVCLPEITGRHALETTTYVDRSWRWWERLEVGG